MPVSILNFDEKVYSVLRERVKDQMFSYGIHGGDIQAKMGVQGELVASQSFEFPTVYGQRSKLTTVRQQHRILCNPLSRPKQEA